MDRLETLDSTTTPLSATPTFRRRGRPLSRRMMHLVRRGHMYAGLFLFPWAILYGFTGFLFNHPTILSDAPTVHFSRADVAGTPLESAPTPQEQAMAVLAALNERHQPSTPYTLGRGEAYYGTRETFVATVKAQTRTFFVVYNPKTASGIIRETTTRAVVEKAPFATGTGDAPRQRGMGMMGPMKHNPQGIRIENSIVDRIKDAIPLIMERKGFPKGEVTVTTAPDIKFPVEVKGQIWTAIYNPLTTTVSGTAGPQRSELSWRTFLLRLHLSRGYPDEVAAKWFWAVIVDAMALTLCFWGLSGLIMWWQIKATRWAGLVVLLVSAVAAAALGWAMHAELSG